jgi:hypothetical protein
MCVLIICTCTFDFCFVLLLSYNSCIARESSGVGGLVFIGNTILVFSIFLIIFIVHFFGISAVEGYWLAKDTARHRIAASRQNSMRRDYSNASLQSHTSHDQHNSNNSANAAPVSSIDQPQQAGSMRGNNLQNLVQRHVQDGSLLDLNTTTASGNRYSSSGQHHMPRIESQVSTMSGVGTGNMNLHQVAQQAMTQNAKRKRKVMPII